MAKGGKPKRYRYTQRWLEHAEKRGEGGYSESCFWAEVEDLSHDTESSFEDVQEKVEALEGFISKWDENGEVGKDVFLEGSTFVKWWKTLPIQLELDLFHGIRYLPSTCTASIGITSVYIKCKICYVLKYKADSFGAFFVVEDSKN